MKQTLTEILTCPQCQQALPPAPADQAPACPACGFAATMARGVPHFIEPPQGLRPSTSAPLPPGTGSAWRRANWEFTRRWAQELAPQARALEVGAGNGYYRPLFGHTDYLATDIHAYKGIDFVCDLIQQDLLRPQSLDFILLANMLEHVLEFDPLLDKLGRALKSGGRLVLTVPFIISLHQQPYDFMRYTHHALRQIMARHGFTVLELQAVYTPRQITLAALNSLGLSFTWDDGWSRNLKKRAAHTLTRVCRRLILAMAPLCDTDGRVQTLGDKDLVWNKLPMGYHLAASKD